MIEMTYKGNSNEKGSTEHPMIPKNVRQIGEVGKERKVYLEDYAVTYMQQVSMAILLGEIRESGNVQYVFVNGAVGVESASLEEADWEQLYREVKEHFENREIIGYYRKMDEEPTEISGEVEELFRTRFSEEGNILVFRDMPEDENVVFLVENGLLKKQPGYYIYYEKNQAMQDYMVDHGQGQSVDSQEEIPDKAIKNFRKIIGEKKEEKEPEKKEAAKGAPKFLYAASTFMVLVIAVIGVTIMNNNDKMNRVESTLSNMAKQTESADETEAMEANAGGKSQTESESAKEEDKEGTDASSQTEPGQDFVIQDSAQENEASVPDSDASASAETETASTETIGTETYDTNASAAGTASTGTDTKGASAVTETQNTQQTEAEAASAPTTSYQSSYTVKYGDTLANICRMYYGNVDKLDEVCEINGITDPNTIIMGQKIVLP